MKKLYSTLALACTVALGASAIAPAQLAKAPRTIDAEVSAIDCFTIEAAQAPAKAPAAKVAVSVDDADAIYTWTYGDLLSDSEEYSTCYGAISSIMGPLVNIGGFFGSFEGTLNEETGELYIEGGQVLAKSTRYDSDILLMSIMPNAEGKYGIANATTDPIIATWDGSKFVFPKGLAITAQLPGDHPTDAYGIFAAWVSCSMSKYTDETTWKTVGTAEFVDGWITPVWGIDPADYPCTATLQQDANNPTRYSLLDPYKNSELSLPDENGETLNTDETAAGRIIFNVEDPDFVFVQPGVYCGYSEETNGRYYPFNQEGDMVVQQGYTPAEAKELFKANSIATSTFKNNVVTLTNLYFGLSEGPLNPYRWTSPEIQQYMTTTIKMTITDGVEDAFIGAENAPVEYYNLQGVRVANPENGLYIRRQGNTATKVLVK